MFFGDRGTWTLTIFKVDGFSSYYKFHCCRHWHVEQDSIFILVRLINSWKDLSDYGVNHLINEYSILSSMWNLFTPILPFSYKTDSVESSLIIWHSIQYVYIRLSFTLPFRNFRWKDFSTNAANSIC